MRTAAALLVAVSVLVGCGGDDDSGADAAVVRSDDGRATLTLPEGIDGDGLTVEVMDVEGAAAAYELLPSGTSFDEPATLTITDVPAPEGNLTAMAIIESDDERDLVDGVTTSYGEDATTATVAVPIAHFSTVRLFFLVNTAGDSVSLAAHAVELGVPIEVGVDTPFDVLVRTEQLGTEVEYDVPWDTSFVFKVTRVRASGSLTATNTSPSGARNLPRYGELPASYRGSAPFRCRAPGPAYFTYTATFTYDIVSDVTFTFGRTKEYTLDETVEIKHTAVCVAGSVTTTTEPTTTTTAAAVDPVVSEIRVDLAVPVSTYSATASVDGGGELSYEWKMSGESCGTPKTPWTQQGARVTWSHADTPPDSCAHAGRDHAVTVSLTVTSDRGSVVTCTFEGSESRVIPNPDCS